MQFNNSTLGFAILDNDETPQQSIYSSILMNASQNETIGSLDKVRRQLFANKDELDQDEQCDDALLDDELKESIKATESVLQKSVVKLQELVDAYIKQQTKFNEKRKQLKQVRCAALKIKEGVKELECLNEPLTFSLTDAFEKYTKTIQEIEESIQKEIEDIEKEKRKSEIVIKNSCLAFGVRSKLYHTCPICFTNEITHFVAMCGHTYCLACVSKMKECCFICNKYVTSINPLFSC